MGDGAEWSLATPFGTFDAAISGAVAIGVPRGERIDLTGAASTEATGVGRCPDPSGRITALRGTPPVSPTLTPMPFHCDIPDRPRHPGGFPLAMVVTAALTAGVAAVFFSPIFALLAGVSALAMIGRWAGSVVAARRATAARVDAIRMAEARWVADTSTWAAEHAELQRRLAFEPSDLLELLGSSVSPWRERLDPDEPVELVLGRGSLSVEVPVAGDDSLEFDRAVVLDDVPIAAAVDPGLAVCGDRAETMAAARWCVASLLTRFGPADLGVVVVTTADRLADWDQLKWVPSFEGCLVADHASADLLVGLLERARRAAVDAAAGRRALVVVDGAEPDVPGELARVLSGRVSGVDLLWVGSADRVPAGCRRRLDLAADGVASLVPLDAVEAVTDRLRWFGLDDEQWSAAARWLGRFADPEALDDDVALPASVALGDLIGAAPEPWGEASLASLRGPIGRDRSGEVVIDLVADGPHVLAAGTTGSGKSELLRTMVVGIAAWQPPDVVSFVLVDFKGGGAFDLVSGLPHVAAVVTDLEPSAAERALRGLRAEILDREHRLRDMGVTDVADVDRHHPRAFGRLVVMVDEFAALADELPDFLDGLVDVARRGRSLGIHLVLATQRPSGVITGQIRANTNLRICLRVQDRSDAIDVIDDPAGGDLPNVPGRAMLRRGGGRTESMQVAHVGGVGSGLKVRPFELSASEGIDGRGRQAVEWAEAHLAEQLGSGLDCADSGVIETLVAESAGVARAAAPWLDVPAAPSFPVAAAERADQAEDGVILGLLDDPDRRLVRPMLWNPATDGLLVAGSDEQRIGATIALAVAGIIDRHPTMPLFVLDGPRRRAEPLEWVTSLPAVVDVVTAAEPERLLRVLERLDRFDEPIGIVVRDWAAIAEALTEIGGPLGADRLVRLVRRATSPDLVVIVSARSDRDVPQRAAAAMGVRIIHRLADPAGYLTFGLRPTDVAAIGRRRFVEPDSGLVGICAELDQAAVAALGERTAAIRQAEWPPPTRLLGSRVERTLLPSAEPARDGWRVPIGLDDDLDPHWIEVSARSPVVVVAQPGGGRSTTLATVARSLGDRACVIDDAERRPDEELRSLLSTASAAERPVVLACTPMAAKRFGSPLAELLPTATVVLVNPTRQEGEMLRMVVPDLSDQPIGRAVAVDRGRATIVQIAA